MAADPPASLVDLKYVKKELVARVISETIQTRTEIDEHLKTCYKIGAVRASSEELVKEAVRGTVRVFHEAREVAARNLAGLEAQVHSKHSQLRLLASLLKLAENLRERSYLPPHLTEGPLTEQLEQVRQAEATLQRLDCLQTEAKKVWPNFSPSKENRRWDNLDSSIQSLEMRIQNERASSPVAVRPAIPAAGSASSSTGVSPRNRPAGPSSSEGFPRQQSPAGWHTAFGNIDPEIDSNLLVVVDEFLSEHGYIPADPPAGNLPFVGREGLHGEWLAAVAYTFECMMRGREDRKEGSSGLSLVEAPAGQGKTRAEQEFSRFERTVPPEELVGYLRVLSPGLDESLLAQFVPMWQSEQNLMLYLDYHSSDIRVGEREYAESSPAASEALRLLAAYTRTSVQVVKDALGAAAYKLSVGTVLLAIKTNYCTLKHIDKDEMVIINIIRDEAQDMVSLSDQAAARTYATEMILSTLAYRSSSLTAKNSMASGHGILLYNIAVGTLLYDLKPPSSSQYKYTYRSLAPLLQSDATEALKLYIQGATKSDTDWEQSLRRDAETLVRQPIIENMIAETSGVGRFVAFLGESLVNEDGYRRLRREERNWLLYVCLVANDFVWRADQWLTTDIVGKLGGVDVVRVLLDLVLSGVAVRLDSHVGGVAADGRTPAGASFTVRDALSTGILYFEIVKREDETIRLIAPAILLVRLAARSGYKIPAYFIQFPALAPVSSPRFEEAVCLREAAFARMVWRYHEGLVSFRTAYGAEAILSPDLEGVSMRILHPKVDVAREAKAFIPQPDAKKQLFPVALVEQTTRVEPRGIANVFDGSKVFLCDPATGANCPNCDGRLARGEELGDGKILIVMQMKRYLTENGDVSKLELESWIAQLDIQLAQYAQRYTVVYAYIVSSSLKDDARKWLKGELPGQMAPKNVVVVDSKELSKYLPLIGHRSVLLKNV